MPNEGFPTSAPVPAKRQETKEKKVLTIEDFMTDDWDKLSEREQSEMREELKKVNPKSEVHKIAYKKGFELGMKYGEDIREAERLSGKSRKDKDWERMPPETRRRLQTEFDEAMNQHMSQAERHFLTKGFDEAVGRPSDQD